MTRALFVAIGLSTIVAKPQIPADISGFVDGIRSASRDAPAVDRARTLLQIVAVLRFHFPEEAKRLAMEADGDLTANDDVTRSEIYKVMLDLDPAEAARMAVRIRDKNALYSAALQHCIENHDVRCGQNILAEGHGSGAYRISNTRWVIEQLAATDPEAARDVFTHVLKLFPKEAGFRDVQILLDAAQAIANTDLELARRAAVALKNAVENPQFESRTPEIVTARFLIDGRQIQTTSTKETVLVQVQSLFERGSFPHLVTATFQMKHPSAVIVHGNNRDPAIDALLRKLSDQVQNLNDFTLEDLNHRTYHLTALRGRPVLLDFWATWCGPCRREMPELDALQRKGLTILAITDEDERVVRKFAAENPHAFLILRDSRGEVFKLYDVGARPTSILINSAGRITARWFELPQRDVVSADLREAGLK